MLRTERSVAIPTGMIIAALYVILLVGFSRESYMRRDAASLDAASLDIASLDEAGSDAANPDAASPGLVAATPPVDDAPKRVCWIDQPVCRALFDGAGQDCAVPFGSLLKPPSKPAASLTLDELRRALRAGP